MLRYLVTDVSGAVVFLPYRGAKLGQGPVVALEAVVVAALEIAQVSKRVQDAAGSIFSDRQFSVFLQVLESVMCARLNIPERLFIVFAIHGLAALQTPLQERLALAQTSLEHVGQT